MANILNYNFNKLDLRLSNSDYWDFFLANDDTSGTNCDLLTSGSCFVVWYDFNNSNTFINNNPETIYSLVSWSGATNTGYTLNTIGLTGIDNGLINFDKVSGDTSNLALLSALTGTTLVIPSGDTRLILNAVTGTTSGLTYDYIYESGSTAGYTIQFLGGFYQGYYKLDGNTYEVLPVRVDDSWSAEFWIKPENITTSGTTLNDLNPNNKGIFFYMGTRAENKFWNQWDGADTGCTSGCTADSGCTDTVSEWCTVPKESSVSIIGDYGIEIPLDPPRIDVDLITNGFQIYGRGRGLTDARYTGATGSLLFNDVHIDTSGTCYCSGCQGPLDGLGSETACSYDGNGVVIRNPRQIITNTTNPFLVYGRGRGHSFSGNCYTCNGPDDGLGNETTCSFSGFSQDETTIDYNYDIIDNAIGFIIKDDGSIGYRLLTVTGECQTISGVSIYVSGVTIEENYSLSGMVNTDVWNYIVIKFVTGYKTDCELENSPSRKGRLSFYVNGKLKYFVDEFDEFIARRLDEYKDKQVGVPFNFSLGGGSQGLVESQTFDGLDFNDRNLPIETNFAGSFIGSISQFKFNICDLSYCNIINNFNDGIIRYNLST